MDPTSLPADTGASGGRWEAKPVAVDAEEGLAAYRVFALPPAIDGGDGNAAVWCPVASRAAVVHADDLNVLGLCRAAFSSLDDHARRVCVGLGYSLDHVDAFRERLRRLVDMGLFVSVDHVRSVLRRSAGLEPSTVSVIGIPTRDRPESLSHCLSSIAWASRQAGRDIEVVIADGSTHPATQRANRAALGEVMTTSGTTIYYSGPSERDRFARELIRAGADPSAARFALVPGVDFPFTAGANRNLLALLASGRIILQVDDDTVFRTTSVPCSGPGMTLTSDQDPTTFWFPGQADITSHEFTDSTDLVTLHEDMLGRGVGDCTSSVPGVHLHADAADASFFQRLRGGGAAVRVTTAGVVGDSGMGPSEYFLHLRGPSRAHLHANEATYLATVCGGPVLRAVGRPTITAGSVCMGLNLGLDLRGPLAPFPPALRNEDGVFGEVTRVCFPSAFMGHLPSAVLHLPPEDRVHTPDSLAHGAGGPRSDQLLMSFIRGWSRTVTSHDGARNLRALGEYLSTIGGLPPEEFRTVVRKAAWELAAGATARLSGLLDEYGGDPAWWAADVRRVIRRYRAAAVDEQYGAPIDLPSGPTPDARIEVFRGFVRQYGHLLRRWCELVEVATDLRSKGVSSVSVPQTPAT